MAAADLLIVCTILMLVVSYGQLVICYGGVESLLSCAGRLGTDPSSPGKSCRDIYEYNMASRGHSGYYWIETDHIHKVYCDMELSCGGIKGGWMRIAKVDTNQGDDCPGSWKKITYPQALCRGSGDAAGCYPAYLSNYKEGYKFYLW